MKKTSKRRNARQNLRILQMKRAAQYAVMASDVAFKPSVQDPLLALFNMARRASGRGQ